MLFPRIRAYLLGNIVRVCVSWVCIERLFFLRRQLVQHLYGTYRPMMRSKASGGTDRCILHFSPGGNVVCFFDRDRIQGVDRLKMHACLECKIGESNQHVRYDYHRKRRRWSDELSVMVSWSRRDLLFNFWLSIFLLFIPFSFFSLLSHTPFFLFSLSLSFPFPLTHLTLFTLTQDGVCLLLVDIQQRILLTPPFPLSAPPLHN